MLHVISLKLKPLLSKGILIAFSKSTGVKEKRGRECSINKQWLPTSQHGYWIAPLLSSPCWREQYGNNVGGYVCFNIGFVSVAPVKTWSICSVLNRREKERVNEKGSCRILEVKWQRKEIIHYTAGFYHACVKGQKSVSSDQWGKSNTAVIWKCLPQSSQVLTSKESCTVEF